MRIVEAYGHNIIFLFREFKDVFESHVVVFILSSIGALVFFIILLLNGFLLFKISRIIRRHSRQIQAQQNSVEQSMGQSINMPTFKKTVHTMYFVIGAFSLCYVPFAGGVIAFDVAQVNIPAHFERHHLFTITETLVMCNGVFNPVIYCWRIKEIRNAVLQFLPRICFHSENHVT
jgi:hypothetical protein